MSITTGQLLDGLGWLTATAVLFLRALDSVVALVIDLVAVRRRRRLHDSA